MKVPEDMEVSLPMGRIMEAARMLGGQGTTYCPEPRLGENCWLSRGIDGYFTADPLDDACPNCWMHWLMTGQ